MASAAVAANCGDPGDTSGLRQCISEAHSASAISQCEQQTQAVLRARIDQLSGAIRSRLPPSLRREFDGGSEAWQTFFEHENHMLSISFQRRADGLGPMLRPGAVTRLLEQREQQLREHLHNLSLVGHSPRQEPGNLPQ